MNPYLDAVRGAELMRRLGSVTEYHGLVVESAGPDVFVGELCEVQSRSPARTVAAEVIGIRDGRVLLMPYEDLRGVTYGAEVVATGKAARAQVGDALLGRVVDAFGAPLDDGPRLALAAEQPLYPGPINPLARERIGRVLETGVRVIDTMLTIGRGQRVAVISGSGIGKSTLLGMIARNMDADVNVIALVGERGREVREFLDDSLGEEGLARSVVVVSTSDRPALERVRAAVAATAIAEGFRKQGKKVLLLVDSVTRFARGLRELGLSAGEPPVRRGYPPSVFAELPRLFERAGNDAHGSITAFYTVLAEDDDNSDPVAEEVRSILDGHIILSRALAQAHHYPAIDVLGSASRVFTRVAQRPHQEAAAKMRSLMARFNEVEFLLRVGEYQAGSDPLADKAIERMPAVKALLQQRSDEPTDFAATIATLQEVVA